MLTADIAAFDRMKSDLEAEHWHEWVLFHRGQFVDAFAERRPTSSPSSGQLSWRT
ncbi:MAG TPA: hypothetical protein VGH86_04945 [Phenylobacterium sp.]